MSTASNIAPTAKGSTFGFVRKPMMRVCKNGSVIELSASVEAELDFPVSLDEMTFFVGDATFPARITARYPLNTKKISHIFRVLLSIPVASIYDLPIQNSVRVGISDGKEGIVRHLVLFDRHLSEYVAARTQFFRDSKDGKGIVAFFRQTIKLNTTFTVQDAAETDSQGNAFWFVSSPKMHVRDNGTIIELCGTMKTDLVAPIPLSDLTFYVGKTSFPTRLIARYPLSNKKTRHIFRIVLLIPVETIYSMPIHNTVRVGIPHEEKGIAFRGIFYNKSFSRYKAAHTTFFKDEETGTVAFFRQTVGLHTRFTVRHINRTDSLSEQFKLTFAWLFSKFIFWIKPILIFEKNARHYEESGRVVFERLVDMGYKNVWFILNEETLDQSTIDQKYRARIVCQYSFAHYFMFFRCRTFLGTEALAHALELRCQSNLVQNKLKNEGNTFVFLQHGVMYMISLNSPERTSFQKKNMTGTPYVVVSSKKEARHFKMYAGFTNNDLIKCGLPKFDRSYLNAGADKILILPTWRSWEFNAMRRDPAHSNYVRMIEDMVAAVPEHLRDKVVVAYHPLFEESTFLSQHTKKIFSYDVLLRDVSLLITDYSSIAYDSFYRGSNVIFYWKELEECMKHYGAGTHLMLTEDTAFGPVCYSDNDLTSSINEVYGQLPDDCYQQRYNQIVEFHDNCNTDRLIKALRKKGISFK